MRKRLENYLRINLLVIMATCCGFAIAQDSATLEVEIKPINKYDFDINLVPAQTIYGTSWDSGNVDSPAYNAEMMMRGYLIDLVPDDCKYAHPFKGVVNSKYGWRKSRWHKGIDIDLEIGDPIYAAFDGVVRIQRYNAGGYGNYVLIRHYNGLETIYGHLSEAIVSPNQTIRAGQIIGFGGSTGHSTGPHLHFETRLMGQAFDPSRIIDFNTYIIKQRQVHINHTWFPYIKGSNTKANTRPATAKKYYKIRKGDTLYSIAKRNGTTINTICRLNGISRKTLLRIGRNLRVK